MPKQTKRITLRSLFGKEKKYDTMDDIIHLSPAKIVRISPENISKSIRSRNANSLTLDSLQNKALNTLLRDIKPTPKLRQDYIVKFESDNRLNSDLDNMATSILEKRLEQLKKTDTGSSQKKQPKFNLDIYRDENIPMTKTQHVNVLMDEILANVKNEKTINDLRRLPPVPTHRPVKRGGLRRITRKIRKSTK